MYERSPSAAARKPEKPITCAPLWYVSHRNKLIIIIITHCLAYRRYYYDYYYDAAHSLPVGTTTSSSRPLSTATATAGTRKTPQREVRSHRDDESATHVRSIVMPNIYLLLLCTANNKMRCYTMPYPCVRVRNLFCHWPGAAAWVFRRGIIPRGTHNVAYKINNEGRRARTMDRRTRAISTNVSIAFDLADGRYGDVSRSHMSPTRARLPEGRLDPRRRRIVVLLLCTRTCNASDVRRGFWFSVRFIYSSLPERSPVNLATICYREQRSEHPRGRDISSCVHTVRAYDPCFCFVRSRSNSIWDSSAAARD